MDLLKSVFFSVLFSLSFLSSSEEVQSGKHNGKAYGNILKTMKLNNSMDLQNLTALLKSLGLHGCSNKADHRHKCVTAKSLFELYNIATTSSLKEMDFAKVATVIVHSLLPPRTRKRSTRFVTKNVYEELLERYATSELCEQILDQMLRDLNESIGKQLNNYKCFSSLEILNEMNISSEAEITKNKFPELSTVIISKLLNKHCIKVGYQTPLPCPSFFLNNMFKKHAQKKYINKTKIEKLLENLKIGKQWSKDAAAGQEVGMDVNHNLMKNRIRNIYDKCYSVDELFSIYHADKKTGFDVKRFEHLSTALLEQIESNACFLEQVEEGQNENIMNKIPKMSVWGFGLAAVSVVSLCSLVMIIPLMKTTFYEKSLIFLISLAVGTLVGDACLHLLPHATGFHHHPDSTLASTDKSYLWRFLSAAAGIYGLFIFETTTHLLFFRKSNEVTPGDNKSTEEKEHTDSKPEIDKKSQLPRTEKQPVVLLNKMTLREDGHPLEKFKAISNLDIITKVPANKHIAPMAWTIIIGDTLHNVADGIAIGVAFSDSIFGGVSTSIAVLCHEVPHELGDFVVLLSAGMNVRQALLANFISALFCFLGYVLGKLIGEIEDVNLWILGITAGFFLYIALTNKLPELMHVSAHSDLPKWVILILQNTGIILGVAGMFFLAYYKKDINF